MMRSMVIDMNDEQLHTLAQMQAFLDGTVTVEFAVAVEERYDFIARTVRRFGYARLKRAEKAVVLRFLERVSGYSRQQLTRLVKRGCERGELIKRYRGSRTSFARIYTSADVLLLAHIDIIGCRRRRRPPALTGFCGRRCCRASPTSRAGDFDYADKVKDLQFGCCILLDQWGE
jgi:hypothetical protein